MEITVAKCPLCGERVKVGTKVWIGREIESPACDAILEIVGLNPVSLDSLYEEETYESDYDLEIDG